MIDASNQHLFVYGTLLSGFGHPIWAHLASRARVHGPARARGRLYDLGSYPGFVHEPDGEGIVYGEVVTLIDAAEALAMLDSYEGCAAGDPTPHEYARQMIPIEGPADIATAWAYVFIRATTGLYPIPSGRYLAYRDQVRDG